MRSSSPVVADAPGGTGKTLKRVGRIKDGQVEVAAATALAGVPDGTLVFVRAGMPPATP